VTAKAVYCFDVEARAAVLAKNCRFRMPPASTVKLATALVLLRVTKGDLSACVEIQEGDCTIGSSMGLVEGDRLTHLDLLHGLLLSSGNDAAQAIARTVGRILLEEDGQLGDPIARFVLAMNELAIELGLTRTRFMNPSGLDVQGLYSTAKDIALLGAKAFSDPVIRAVSQKTTYSAEIFGNKPRRIDLTTTVTILGEHGVLCGKTGTTSTAGSCLVLYSFASGRPFVTVLLASNSEKGRYDDARSILIELVRRIEHNKRPFDRMPEIKGDQARNAGR